MRLGTVYVITNQSNGRQYVGATVLAPSVRWSAHRAQIKAGTHPAQELVSDWQEHGSDVFRFSILEDGVDPTDLPARESAWIDAAKTASQLPLYNKRLGSEVGHWTGDRLQEKSSVMLGAPASLWERINALAAREERTRADTMRRIIQAGLRVLEHRRRPAQRSGGEPGAGSGGQG